MEFFDDLWPGAAREKKLRILSRVEEAWPEPVLSVALRWRLESLRPSPERALEESFALPSAPLADLEVEADSSVEAFSVDERLADGSQSVPFTAACFGWTA